MGMGKGRDNGIRIEGLHKRYGEGDTAVDALKDVNVVVAPGEVVGLIGPSGSGKGTLLKCLVAVIERSGGRMVLGGKTIFEDGCKIPDLRALRRDGIGFVFQAPYLIPFLDVTYNVARLPMLAGRPNGEARARAVELPNALDVGHRAKAWPSEPSGGDQGQSACPGGRPGACGPAVGPCVLERCREDPGRSDRRQGAGLAARWRSHRRLRIRPALRPLQDQHAVIDGDLDLQRLQCAAARRCRGRSGKSESYTCSSPVRVSP